VVEEIPDDGGEARIDLCSFEMLLLYPIKGDT